MAETAHFVDAVRSCLSPESLTALSRWARGRSCDPVTVVSLADCMHESFPELPQVKFRYKTKEVTARHGKDFIKVEGVLEFDEASRQAGKAQRLEVFHGRTRRKR